MDVKNSIMEMKELLDLFAYQLNSWKKAEEEQIGYTKRSEEQKAIDRIRRGEKNCDAGRIIARRSNQVDQAVSQKGENSATTS